MSQIIDYWYAKAHTSLDDRLRDLITKGNKIVSVIPTSYNVSQRIDSVIIVFEPVEPDTVISFKSTDGLTYKTRSETKWANDLDRALKEIMSWLPKRPEDKDCAWSNGRVYVQCELARVNIAKSLFKYLYNSTFGVEVENFTDINSRLLDDSRKGNMYGIWNLLTWIDSSGRWWGQKYYCLNPQTDAERYEP